VRAAELLPERFPRLSEAVLARGVASVRWPGRLELVRSRDRSILLDGCHNPQGAAALAAFLQEIGLAGRCRLVFGAMADKPIEEMAQRLFPLASLVTLVPAPSARAATSQELARRIGSFAESARVASSLEDALEDLLREEDAEPIIVAGSLYLVGQARLFLLEGGSGRGRS